MGSVAYGEAANAEKRKRTESEQRAEARLKLEKTAPLTYLLTAPKFGYFFSLLSEKFFYIGSLRRYIFNAVPAVYPIRGIP